MRRKCPQGDFQTPPEYSIIILTLHMLTKCPQACAFSNIEVLDICDMPVIGVTPSATHNL